MPRPGTTWTAGSDLIGALASAAIRKARTMFLSIRTASLRLSLSRSREEVYMKRGAVSLKRQHEECKPCSLQPRSPRGEYRQTNACWSSREHTGGKAWLLRGLTQANAVA